MSNEPNPLMNWQMQALNLEFELAKMRPVYDAAMAWLDAIDARTRLAFDMDTPQEARKLADIAIDTAELHLEAVCRRAKEGSRG